MSISSILVFFSVSNSVYGWKESREKVKRRQRMHKEEAPEESGIVVLCVVYI